MIKKIYIIIVFLNVVFYAKAQESKEQKKHKEKIEKSFKKQSAEVSLDTLFYKGLPNCIYRVNKKSILGVTDVSVFSLKNNLECLKVAMHNEGEGSAAVYTWKWIVALPNNNTVIETKFSESPYDLIAKHNVMNDSTINETGLKNLVNMEAIDKTIKVQIVQPNAKPKMIERNRAAMILIMGENIMQDNKTIGKIKQESKAANGNVTMLYSIYNTDNVLIATAENEEITGHHWHVNTTINNNIAHLNSSVGKDSQDIIKYLVDGLYI